MVKTFTDDLLNEFEHTVTGGASFGGISAEPVNTSPCNSGIWEFTLTGNTGGSTGGCNVVFQRPAAPGEASNPAVGLVKFGPLSIQIGRFVKEPVENCIVDARTVDGVAQCKKVNDFTFQANVGYPEGISFHLSGSPVIHPAAPEYWTIRGVRIFPT